jgi:tetratricopeptide (TPR) repeat protein
MKRFLVVILASLGATCIASAQDFNGALTYSLEEIREAILTGGPATHALGLQVYFAQLGLRGPQGDAALAAAEEFEGYLSDADERADLQFRVAAAYRERGDQANYQEHLALLEKEYPDPATTWGYHVKYERALEHVRQHEHTEAAKAFEPLLANAEQVSPEQRARIGVQLSNVYKLNGDYDKVIVLAELTRSRVSPENPYLLTLLDDLAHAYLKTENYELAAVTFEELAAAAARINPDSQPPDFAATCRAMAPEQAEEARKLADMLRNAAAKYAETPAPAPSQPRETLAALTTLDENPMNPEANRSSRMVTARKAAAAELSALVAPERTPQPQRSSTLTYALAGAISAATLSVIVYAASRLHDTHDKQARPEHH